LPHAAEKTWCAVSSNHSANATAVSRLSLDERFPAWGESPYVSLELSATVTLQTLLTHLYVLIPVLDNEKHYWVGARVCAACD